MKTKNKLNRKTQQHTRKIPYFKKKHHKSTTADTTITTIPNQIDYEHRQTDTEQQIVEDRTTVSSIFPLSLMKKKCYPLYTESNTDPTLFLSDYSMISNKTFKEMLLAILLTDMNKNHSLIHLFD